MSMIHKVNKFLDVRGRFEESPRSGHADAAAPSVSHPPPSSPLPLPPANSTGQRTTVAVNHQGERTLPSAPTANYLSGFWDVCM